MKNFFMGLYLKVVSFFNKYRKQSELPETTTEPVDSQSIYYKDGVAYPHICVNRIKAFNPEVQVIRKAEAILNTVLESALFKNKVLTAEFTETKGMSNLKIYNTFASKISYTDVNVFTGSIHQNHITKTIGYVTRPGEVNVNRFFVRDAYEFADNFIHEVIGHNSGFFHDGAKETSIPYQLNRIFAECVKELKL